MVVYINERNIPFLFHRKISVRNKEYTNNEFKYQREERIQINSAEEMAAELS